ncbi:N-6 DNA methylase [Vulcanisaeta moutnovskia]|nr:N-6 DNA methylase [Vulcanisaeta moutnovskia]
MYLIDEQYEIQRSVDRKSTSSYYTSRDGLAVIRNFLKELSEDYRKNIIVMDPFAGSGATLSAINDLIKPKKVIAIEINKGPCELTRKILSSLYDNVEVVCGDTFKIAWSYRADLIITNPPFVRWHLVRNRDELIRLMDSMGYGKLIVRRDPGLHVLSFFLIDYILKDGGYVILVIPASTFYTEQGKGAKKLLKSRYDVIGLVENRITPSFSDGSGFKELIIFARKKSGLIGFIDGSNVETEIYYYEGKLRKTGTINLQKLPAFADRNWLSLFNYERASMLISIIERALDNGLLRYLNKHEIARGVEMYGPDFFFIPNAHWAIVREDESSIIISNRSNGTKLVIPRKYLVKCLRKPEYYNDNIYISDPEYYVLAITEEPKGDLGKYVEWGEGLNIPALKFGSRWYQHVWRQLQVKKPHGYIFIHDKIDLERNKVIANYSERPLCASKNFYVIKTNNPLIAAWYNSSIFKETIKVFGRRISETWTRLLEDDYLAIPVPSKIMNIDLRNVNNIDEVINKYLGL